MGNWGTSLWLEVTFPVDKTKCLCLIKQCEESQFSHGFVLVVEYLNPSKEDCQWRTPSMSHYVWNGEANGNHES